MGFVVNLRIRRIG